MSGKRHEPGILGFFEEGLVEIRVCEREWDVHPRPGILRNRILVEGRAIDRRVELARLLLVELAHRVQSTLALEPLQNEPRDVPGIRRRRVHHGAVLRHRGEVEDRRRARTRASDQILAHDDEREPGRADVLLRAGINDPELRYVDRTRKDRRGHVRDERYVLHIGHEVILDAADRLVGRVMHVRRIRRQLPVRNRRNRRIRRTRIRGDVHLREALRLADRLLRPRPGIHEIDDALRRRQIQRNARELCGRTALQEQHLVVARNREKLPQIRFGLLRDRDECLAAMAHLHHGHSRAVPIEHLIASLLEDFEGENGRTGTEVKDAHGTE